MQRQQIIPGDSARPNIRPIISNTAYPNPRVLYHCGHNGPKRIIRQRNLRILAQRDEASTSQPFSTSMLFSTTSTSALQPRYLVPEEPRLVTVRFSLKFKTSWGQGVKLIGSHPKMGSWSLGKALELSYMPGDNWTATVQLPAGGVFEYKYVVIDHNTKQAISWQDGANSILALDLDELEVFVQDNWGNAPGSSVEVDGMAITRENKLQKWASTLVSQQQASQRQIQDLTMAAQEGIALKGEVSRLKMELGLTVQNQKEAERRVTELESENSRLQNELSSSRTELQNSLTEALKLLDEELDDESLDDSESDMDELSDVSVGLVNGVGGSVGKGSFGMPSKITFPWSVSAANSGKGASDDHAPGVRSGAASGYRETHSV